MPGSHAHADRTGAVVTAAMLLMAVLGVVTVFRDPIAAILFPPAPGSEPAERGR